MFNLVLAACGSRNGAGGAPEDTTTPVDSSGGATTTTIQSAATTTSTGASAGTSIAIVTFEEDGSTLDFALDECFTSETAPGQFADGVGPEGAFSSHGVRDDGWELQLSVLIDANGETVNFSFLTDGVDTDYQLGNLTYQVDGGNVTASVVSDIYQTFGEEEAIPLSFDVSC